MFVWSLLALTHFYVAPSYQSDGVWDLLHNKGGYFYVCGSTAMGKDVLAAVKNIAVSRLGADEGEKWFKSLQSQRYIAELWG